MTTICEVFVQKLTRHDEDRSRHRRRDGNVAQRTFESVEHAAEWTVQPWPRSAAMGDEVSWQSHLKILEWIPSRKDA